MKIEKITENKIRIIIKSEDFKDKKPAEAVTYDRKMGTVTQELWDTLIVNKGKISFIRFGAGEDRVIG